VACVLVSILPAVACGGDLHDDCEGAATTWSVATDAGTVVVHERSREGAHRGTGCERIVALRAYWCW